MHFTVLSILFATLILYQRSHYKAKQRLQQSIINEDSQYSYIDSLLEHGIITEYEHTELITRIKENEK